MVDWGRWTPSTLPRLHRSVWLPLVLFAVLSRPTQVWGVSRKVRAAAQLCAVAAAGQRVVFGVWWVRESARLVRWTALAGSHTYAPSGALWPNSSLCFCMQTGR